MDMSKLPAKVKANTAKIDHLSAEVSRIASTLARLTMQPDVSSTSHLERSANDRGRIAIPFDAVRKAIQLRRIRYEFFDKELFADPAWDMLLELYQTEIAQHRVTVSSLCTASGVPVTTALRWIKAMTEADLLRRHADPYDARRFFVELTPMATAGMCGYFEKIGELLPASD